MSLIVVDCESDGPVPHLYSLVCFGTVVVEEPLSRTFYGQTKPISDKYDPEALAISGFTREQHLTFDDPLKVMSEFESWLAANSSGHHPVFISDNPAFDWQWINYYMWRFLGRNVMGFSARRIGDLFAGMKMDMRAKWKHLRKTTHDHNPVNDAKGNAEALIAMKKMGLRVPF